MVFDNDFVFPSGTDNGGMDMTRKRLAFFTAACVTLSTAAVLPKDALDGLGLMSANAAVTNGVDGNITYEFDDTTGTLTLSGTGIMDDHVNGYAPWASWDVEKVIVGKGITSIGNGAFYGLQDLESVTLPSTVTSIGNYAFCLCKSLKETVIPDKVKSIGEYAFSECSSLKTVNIPK